MKVVNDDRDNYYQSRNQKGGKKKKEKGGSKKNKMSSGKNNFTSDSEDLDGLYDYLMAN